MYTSSKIPLGICHLLVYISHSLHLWLAWSSYQNISFFLSFVLLCTLYWHRRVWRVVFFKRTNTYKIKTIHVFLNVIYGYIYQNNSLKPSNDYRKFTRSFQWRDLTEMEKQINGNFIIRIKMKISYGQQYESWLSKRRIDEMLFDGLKRL